MEEHRRWEDNIKMDLTKISFDVMSYQRIEINEETFVNVLLNLQVT